MKALFYNFQKRKFILKEVPIPKIKSDEALVRVKVSALCGTDLHIMDGPLAYRAYSKKEIILGHSYSGIVSAVGKNISNFKVGDRVFGSDLVWCGKCQRCKEKRENCCPNLYFFGMEAPGSHAEYLSVPARVLFHLSKNVSFEEGSLICDLLAVDCHPVKKANIQKNDKVMIFGAGPVGLVFGMLLKSFGVKLIALVEPIRYRKEFAKKLFNPKIISIKKLRASQRQFDAVFETSGKNQALEAGYKLLRSGGRLMMIGVQAKNFNLNSFKFIARELTLSGSLNFTTKEIKESLKLVENKKIDLKKVITHRFFLNNGEKAYRLLKNRHSGKIILIP